MLSKISRHVVIVGWIVLKCSKCEMRWISGNVSSSDSCTLISNWGGLKFMV